MESWKSIPDFEGLYEISNKGRVRRLVSVRCKKIRVLKSRPGLNDYLRVSLCKNSWAKDHMLHRLVAQAFLKPKKGCTLIHHIDTDKTNNCVENLEYTTHAKNATDAIEHGIIFNRGQLTGEQRREIRRLRKKGLSANEIVAEVGTSQRTVFRVIHRKHASHL